MKQLFLLAILLGFSASTIKAELRVLTCEPEWKSLVEELAGDKVNASSATTGKQDPHRIQARPSLIAKARRADLLICTGADLEAGWLPLLIRKSGNADIQPYAKGYFMATDHVLLMEKPEVLDRSQGDIHAAGNPHVHLDPRRILEIAKALAEKLQALDIDNSTYYQERYQDFELRWNKAIEHWQQKAATLKNKNIITYHRSWIYFQDWLQLNLISTIEAKPGIPPSSGQLAKLIKQSSATEVEVIFHAAYSHAKSAEWLASKTNIPLVTLPYTVGGLDNVNDLFSMFDTSINLLLEATNK